MRRFVQMNLDLEGYEVMEAENGLRALGSACVMICPIGSCWT